MSWNYKDSVGLGDRQYVLHISGNKINKVRKIRWVSEMEEDLKKYGSDYEPPYIELSSELAKNIVKAYNDERETNLTLGE